MKEFSILFFLLMFLNHTLFFYHLQKIAVKKRVMYWKKITKTFSVFSSFFPHSVLMSQNIMNNRKWNYLIKTVHFKIWDSNEQSLSRCVWCWWNAYGNGYCQTNGAEHIQNGKVWEQHLVTAVGTWLK